MNKCYIAHGGDELVIGGKLTILKGASVEGLNGYKQAEYQPDSEAATVAALRDDFNRLLAALKASGVMAAETTVLKPGDSG